MFWNSILEFDSNSTWYCHKNKLTPNTELRRFVLVVSDQVAAVESPDGYWATSVED